jgi:hypothetical protein
MELENARDTLKFGLQKEIIDKKIPIYQVKLDNI